VYCGNAIWPHNEEGLENLARYIIRASFSQERMTYIAADASADGVAKVIYGSTTVQRMVRQPKHLRDESVQNWPKMV